MGKRVIYICDRCNAEKETADYLPKDWHEIFLREGGSIHFCPECYKVMEQVIWRKPDIYGRRRRG